MECRIFPELPDDDFWNTYAQLWKNCLHQSVFQSPSFIKTLAIRFKESILLFQCTKGEALVAAVFFRKIKNTYYFLSDVKTDHNFFVIDRQLREQEIEQIFASFFDLIRQKKLAFVLNKQPSWATYMPIFERLGNESKLFWGNRVQTLCPVLEQENPQAFFKKINKTKLRYQFNRLKKQQGAVYEVFTDDECLEEWVQGFCQVHIRRWDNTSTPSDYRAPQERQYLLEIFQSWADDGILRRFSILIGDQRIAFNVCLQQNDHLIGHSQTYDPKYFRYSPGRALMIYIGKWMVSHDMSKLDFGVGNEGYKSFFSTKNLEVHRVGVAHPSNTRFILRTKMDHWIRKNKTLIAFYRKQIKPRFRLNYHSVIWTSCTFLF